MALTIKFNIEQYNKSNLISLEIKNNENNKILDINFINKFKITDNDIYELCNHNGKLYFEKNYIQLNGNNLTVNICDNSVASIMTYQLNTCEMMSLKYQIKQEFKKL